jgi:hypothetical protein
LYECAKSNDFFLGVKKYNIFSRHNYNIKKEIVRKTVKLPGYIHIASKDLVSFILPCLSSLLATAADKPFSVEAIQIKNM